MKAISTRYVGATERRPARIIASDQDGNRYVLPADGDFPYTNVHQAAAVALCRSMGWPGAEALVGGTVKIGMVWVFTHEQPPAADSDRALLARALPMLITLGDHIGNGPIDPARPGSLGARCDLIGDIRDRVDVPQPRRCQSQLAVGPLILTCKAADGHIGEHRHGDASWGGR